MGRHSASGRAAGSPCATPSRPLPRTGRSTTCPPPPAVQSGDAAGPYCRPLSGLAGMCLDMPSMRGCANYTALCGGAGSAVKQCAEGEQAQRRGGGGGGGVGVDAGGGGGAVCVDAGRGVDARALLTRLAHPPCSPALLTRLAQPYPKTPAHTHLTPHPRPPHARTESPIPHALLTDATVRDVLAMCATHAMDGCRGCTGAAAGSCPDPLGTVAALCMGEPAAGWCEEAVWVGGWISAGVLVVWRGSRLGVAGGGGCPRWPPSTGRALDFTGSQSGSRRGGVWGGAASRPAGRRGAGTGAGTSAALPHPATAAHARRPPWPP